MFQQPIQSKPKRGAQAVVRGHAPPGPLATALGPCPPFWFTKNNFLERDITTRKPTLMRKGIRTFDSTFLTKVTYMSSILKFVNTESLVVQVSNTRFNIQMLHL